MHLCVYTRTHVHKLMAYIAVECAFSLLMSGVELLP